MAGTGILARLLGAFTPDTKAVARLDKPQLTTSGGWQSQLGGVQLLPHPDEVIATEAGSEGLGFYRRIRRQVPYVAGLFKLRIDAACALPVAWVAGDEDDAGSRLLRDIVADAWNAMPDSAAAERKMLLCIADGIGVGELVWGQHVANVRLPEAPDAQPGNPLEQAISSGMESIPCLLPRIIDRQPQFFGFDAEGRLVFLGTTGRDHRALDPLQYIVSRYGSADVWGDGEMREAYADVWKLDTIDKMALRALEKQGYPLLRVLVPEAWDADKVRQVRTSIAATYPNYVVIPFGDRYEEQLVSESGAPTFLGADQIARINKLQETLSISILGVAFSNGQSGSYARDQVRNELRFEKTSADASARDSIRTDWARKFCAVNFPSVPTALWPRSVTDSKPTDDLTAWVDSAVKMSALGFPVSRSQASIKLGLDIASGADDTLATKTAPAQPWQVDPPAPTPEDERPFAVMSESGEVMQFDTPAQFREAMGFDLEPHAAHAPAQPAPSFAECISIPTDSGAVLSIPRAASVKTANRGIIAAIDLVTGDELVTLKE